MTDDEEQNNNAQQTPQTPQFRRNGLAGPHSWMQLSTWILLPALLLELVLVAAPCFPTAIAIGVAIVGFILVNAAAYFGYMATATDPMDPLLKQKFSSEYAAGQPQEPPQLPEDEQNNTKYCWVCESDVLEESMHCKFCNKCVDTFDHHCQWLNHCVGKPNYGWFYKTLWSITLLLLFHFGVLVAACLRLLLWNTDGDDENEVSEAEAFFGTPLIPLVIHAIFLIVDSASLILIGQLLFFHLKLRRNDLTTYKFILKDNQEKRDRRALEERRQAKRMVAITKAKREKKFLLARRLQFGGNKVVGSCCAPCDPLEDDENDEERSTTTSHVVLEGRQQQQQQQQ